jgi:putative NIF3 family GTP cyclohydrolase 1 type 2
MEYYSAARTQGADIFITGDVRYHDFHRSQHDNILLIDAGHAETERFVTGGMLKAALRAYNVVNLHNETVLPVVIQSVVSSNVVRYYQKKERL